MKPIAMVKGEKGVWSVTVTGDLAGKYYTYVVTNGSYNEKEIVDPYAKGCGLNGQRGMVVDFSKTNPTGWENVLRKPTIRNP
jgi:pullulanase